MSNTVDVCRSCATAIINDDWTHLDFRYSSGQADLVMAQAEAFMVGHGWLTIEDESDFNILDWCPCCGECECEGFVTMSYEK